MIADFRHNLGAAVLILGGMLPLSVQAADILEITPQQMERLGIRMAEAAPASEQTVTSILGTVTPALNARLQIAAPFAGTVHSYARMEGETVWPGDTLAIIASPNFRDANADLASRQAQYTSAKAAAGRARMLAKEGIASAAQAEQATARESEAEAMLAAARQNVRRAQAVQGADGQYRLVAASAGRVAGISLQPGEHVEDMETVLTLDTGDALWIEARLPAAMVGKVKAGDAIIVEGTDIRGQVVAVAGSIDPRTRSAVLRASVTANPSLVVGQTVRISIVAPSGPGALSVPRNAVVHLGDTDAVFVAEAGSFKPTPVTVLAQGAQETTVSGNLDSHVQVAVTGLTELKALALQD